jgi:hypothetical protein
VGQTRQVTVYRLICKGTVEERMLHLARNKKDVQDIVVGNKSVAEVNSGKEIVSMLLDDEDVSLDVDPEHKTSRVLMFFAIPRTLALSLAVSLEAMVWPPMSATRSSAVEVIRMTTTSLATLSRSRRSSMTLRVTSQSRRRNVKLQRLLSTRMA